MGECQAPVPLHAHKPPSWLSQRASQLPLKPVWPVSRTRLPAQNCGSSITTSSRSFATSPKLLQHLAVPQGIHRQPKPVVPVNRELTPGGQSLQRLSLPHHIVTTDEIDHRRVENKKASIDPSVITVRLFVRSSSPDHPLTPRHRIDPEAVRQ